MYLPLVSIIIPTFNRSQLIFETLDSVLAQTYENWECLIVDDGSSDDTENVVSEYVTKDSRFQFHQRPNNRLKGANACRNFGFENSKGQYVMFIDSDDICETFCLTERVSIVTKDLSIDILIRDTALLINNIKQKHSINKDPKVSSVENYLRMFLRYEIPWTIMGAFYKRNIIEICTFDEELKRFQDVSLNIKVLSRFSDLKLIRDFTIDSYYRDDKNKVFNNNFIENMFEALFIFYGIHAYLFKNIKYKLDFRKFISQIIIQFGIVYFYQNRRVSNKFFLWTIKLNVFKLSQKITLLFMMFFININLFKLQGIGMYKFRNKLKKKLYK
ncbi:WcaA Glycosyltransferases involved in cell wall biogenesis [Flavobacteriaceae bacterium]